MTPPAEQITIPSPDGPLTARLHHPQTAPKAMALISHGLQSSMESVKLTSLCALLARSGYLAMQFDHLGCGLSPGRELDTTLSGRCQEFLAAADFLRQAHSGLALAYLGSSLGGSVVLAVSEQSPPACSVVWSAPTNLQELVEIMRNNPGTPAFTALARDIPNHDLPGMISRLSRVLFVHGQEDEVVPVAQARLGHELCQEPKDILILPGADHRLSRKADQELALSRTLAWLKRHAS